MAQRGNGSKQLRFTLKHVPLRTIRSPSAAVPPALKISVEQLGVLQPIVVAEAAHNQYILLEGRKRYLAACECGLKKVPALCLSECGSLIHELARWHPQLSPPEVQKYSWERALLREAARRGLIGPEDIENLQGLKRGELIEALRRVWKQKCAAQEKSGAPAPEGETSDGRTDLARVDLEEGPPLGRNIELEQLAVENFKTEDHETSPGVSFAGTAKAAGADSLRAVDIPPAAPPEVAEGQEHSEGAGQQEPETAQWAREVEALFEGVRSGECLRSAPVEQLIGALFEACQRSPMAPGDWQRPPGVSLLAAHSLLVTKLALRLAGGLSWTRLQAIRLGVAALLHDAGLARCSWDPKEAACEGPLLGEPIEHPAEGVRLIEEARAWGSQIQSVCLDHHERFDGSGKPSGKKGEAVDLPARIVAFLDRLATLVLPWSGQPVPPFKATEIVGREAGRGAFDPMVFRAFLAHFSRFPLGTVLQLSTGEVVQVVAPDPRKPSAPRVQVVEPADQADREFPLPDPSQVAEDLTLLQRVPG